MQRSHRFAAVVLIPLLAVACSGNPEPAPVQPEPEPAPPPVVDDSAERAGAFLDGRPFSVHVLGADEADWADRFSRGDCRLSADEVHRAETGAPILKGALARFDCLLHEQVPMGDHQILVGRVTHFGAREGAGLTFFRGRYGRIQEGVE